MRCHSCLQILLIYAKSTNRRASHVENESMLQMLTLPGCNKQRR